MSAPFPVFLGWTSSVLLKDMTVIPVSQPSNTSNSSLNSIFMFFSLIFGDNF